MLRGCIALLFLLTGSARAQSDTWALPDGFVLDTVAADLFLPVNVALAPASADPDAPLAYVTELYGRVKVVTHRGDVFVYADSLLNFEPTGAFPGSGELGVTGLALEPETGDLFVTHVYDDDGIKNRVVRMVSSADGLRADTILTLLDGIPGPTSSHQIQQVTLGPDGALYVQVGDGFEKQAAQDDDDLRGKVLRLNQDGTVPADNPTPGSYVYAKGVRNPFGGAWRPEDGHLYLSDNGPDGDDRIARIEPGGNYGWPPSMLPGAIHLWNPSVAPTAVDFCAPASFPAPYRGDLYVALSGPTYLQGMTGLGKRIEHLTLDDDGAVVAVDTLLRYVGDGFATVVGLACDADALYFTDLYGEAGFDAQGRTQATLYRVRYLGPIGTASEPAPSSQLTHFPNPFSDRLTINVEPGGAAWRLEVVDLLGRRVRRLAEGNGQQSRQVVWDGRDASGQPVSAGVYLLRLESGSGVIVHPAVLVR